MQLIGYKDAAALLGMEVGALRAHVSRRTVPHVRIGPRCVRFDVVELGRWLESRRVPTRNAGGEGR